MASLLAFGVILLMLFEINAGLSHADDEDVQTEPTGGRVVIKKSLMTGLKKGDVLEVEAVIRSTTGPPSPRVRPDEVDHHALTFEFAVNDTEIPLHFMLFFKKSDSIVVIDSMRNFRWQKSTYTDMTAFEPYLTENNPAAFTLAFSVWDEHGILIELLPGKAGTKRHFWVAHWEEGVLPGAIRRFSVLERGARIEVKKLEVKAKQ